jgi:hypothetical protein
VPACEHYGKIRSNGGHLGKYLSSAQTRHRDVENRKINPCRVLSEESQRFVSIGGEDCRVAMDTQNLIGDCTNACMIFGNENGFTSRHGDGIAAGFWIVAATLLWIFGWLLRMAALGRNVSMLPRGGIELTLWIALSVTAGICEERIFRGYLQRQFMALTMSTPVGILLSAAAFGVAHAYQGFRMVILIGLYGAMGGILAYWRGSVRPGMNAHAWQDSLNGVLASLPRR